MFSPQSSPPSVQSSPQHSPPASQHSDTSGEELIPSEDIKIEVDRDCSSGEDSIGLSGAYPPLAPDLSESPSKLLSSSGGSFKQQKVS